jgi:hypothetical protein
LVRIAKRRRVSEAQRGANVAKFRSGYGRARACSIRSRTRGIWEETTKQVIELQGRYLDAFLHDAVDPGVTLCKAMGTLGL